MHAQSFNKVDPPVRRPFNQQMPDSPDDLPTGNYDFGSYPLSPGERFKFFAERNRGKLFLLAVAALAVVIGLFTSFYQVDPEGRGVVQRFGRYYATTGPGLHYKLPFGIDTATFVPTEAVQKEEFGYRTLQAGKRTQYSPQKYSDESLMLAGDLTVIDVEWVVQYQITDPVKYLFQVRDPTETIRDVSEAVMRRVVGNRLGNAVLTSGRAEVEDRSKIEMQGILEDYDAGIRVIRVALQDVTPPEKVKPSFNDVNKAEQERDRSVNEAERKRNEVIPRARGEAEQVKSQAAAYAAGRVNEAKGAAARFTAILQEYKASEDVTRRRLYLEMVDKVLPKVGRVYVVEKGQPAPLPLMNLDGSSNSPLVGGGAK